RARRQGEEWRRAHSHTTFPDSPGVRLGGVPPAIESVGIIIDAPLHKVRDANHRQSANHPIIAGMLEAFAIASDGVEHGLDILCSCYGEGFAIRDCGTLHTVLVGISSSFFTHR